MSDSRYFVVQKRNGVEHFMIYHDWLPSWATSKQAQERGVVFVLRLDTTEYRHADLMAMTQNYYQWKAQNTLPASNLAKQ